MDNGSNGKPSLISIVSSAISEIVRVATTNVESRLEEYIKKFEVVIDLEPIYRALRERRSNDIAKYLEYHINGEQVKEAGCPFSDNNYDILVNVSQSPSQTIKNIIGIFISDLSTGYPANVDLSQKAKLALIDSNGNEILFPIKKGECNFVEFSYQELAPQIYVARLRPIEN